ncbi:hypothetical protein G6F19_003283 [Rhizopus arrhizus]|nr:hypothetical protein G6F19_003283 [Rhizopus arrhizus]
MQAIVSEPYHHIPSNVHSRRTSAATSTRSARSMKDRRRSSGALSSHSQQQKPRKYIGDYIVGKTLGKGASGRVKLGVHRLTGEQIAIKIISKSHLAANPAIEKAVRREIAIMKYLLLEYVEGGELFEYLVSKGRLDEEEARHHFQQIILGLDYCHHHLICHRDLKPENLLLDSNHNIKIADFGMASLQPLGSLLETSCGSPHYASPEIVAGMAYHGSSCDIWSCGVILFALLTGHLPFDDENIRQLLRKVKSGKYVMPENISRSAQDLIRRILVVDPSKRLTMKQIMDHPWFKETEPSNIHTLPIPPTDIGQPVSHPSEIDDRLLETIKFLWGESDNQVIVNALLQKEHNMQKVVYVLLQQHAEKYWQSDHDDEADEEIIDIPFNPRQYKTLDHRSERDRRCFSVAPKSVAPWVPEETETLRRKSAVDQGTEKMKKSETFYSKFVKKALSPRRSSKDVSKVAADSTPTSNKPMTLVGTLRRKTLFGSSNNKPTIAAELAEEDVKKNQANEARKSATLNAKGLSLRLPKGATVNSKKFGFTLGSKQHVRKQLDLSIFNEPVPLAPPALSDGSTLSSSSSSCTSSSSSFPTTANESKAKPNRRSSQASMDPRTHRPTTPSLLSNSSTITATNSSPTEASKPSWLQQLFFFKQPKVCSFIIYSTNSTSIFRTLHRLMNKTTETRFYEKCDRNGTIRYKAEIKTKPSQGKARQVKCKVELIMSESDCIVQFTQQQGDGVLLNTTIHQILGAILKEFPCPDLPSSSGTLVEEHDE